MKKFMKEDFEVRSYGKTELAQLYMPDISPRSALATFRYWIARYPGLKERLAAQGVTPQIKRYTPSQVQLIVMALGTPG